MNANQSETVITGLHSETTESEVTDMLKEMMNEIGMDFGSVKLACPAKPITHTFIYFANDNERKQVHQVGKHVKKRIERKENENKRDQWRLKKDFTTKEWDMSKVAFIKKTRRPSRTDLPELDYQTCISQRTDGGKNMSRWISQVQQIPRCGRRS